jgi:hypothetical protein
MVIFIQPTVCGQLDVISVHSNQRSAEIKYGLLLNGSAAPIVE